MHIFKHARCAFLAALTLLTVAALSLHDDHHHFSFAVSAQGGGGGGNDYHCANDYNCNSCGDDGRCTDCKTYTGVTADGRCERCLDPFCAACGRNVSACVECQEGHVLARDNVCRPCDVPHCTLCQSSGQCEECEDGYGYYAGDEVRVCDKCVDQFCVTCTLGGTACLKCVEGYIAYNRTCTRCAGAGCLNCYGDNFELCGWCKEGTVLNSANTCSPCPDNCRTCAVEGAGPNTRCTACNTRYGLTADGTCIPCGDSHCVECVVEGSGSAAAAPRCTGCDTQYSVSTSNNTCARCADPHCAVCGSDEVDRCHYCSTGYYFSDTGRCVAIRSNNAARTLAGAAAGPLAAALVAAVVVAGWVL